MSENNQKPKLRVANISCIIPESRKYGGIFLGNIYGAQNADILKQYGIRSVLTSSLQTPSYDLATIPFHLKIKALDQDNYSIVDHLSECFQFLDETRKYTNVLIHCYAGVSRSVSIVVAYIMKQYKWDLVTTLEFVKQKRVVAKPNDGFMKQLKKFEQTLDLNIKNKSNYEENPYNGTSRVLLQRNLIPARQNRNQQNQNMERQFSNQNANKIKFHQQQKSKNNEFLGRNINNNLQLERDHEKSRTIYQSFPNKQQNNKQLHFNSNRHSVNIGKKRHSDVPIPAILTKNNPNKKQYNNNQYNQQTSYQNLYQTKTNRKQLNNINKFDELDRLQHNKTKSRLIRPKDLPGYRQH